MAELVNMAAAVQRHIEGTGFAVSYSGENFIVSKGAAVKHRLRVVRLYHPSAEAVVSATAPDVLLVLVSPSMKAKAAAANTNYVILPSGAFRIVLPGIVLIREIGSEVVPAAKTAKLTGAAGVIAETLLQGGVKPWSVNELAQTAQVAPSFVHRVLARLQNEGVIEATGAGPHTRRTLNNDLALAELWRQEERVPAPIWRGYAYAASPEALVKKALQTCPDAVAGGVFAANWHLPFLTRVPYPIRLWVPNGFLVEDFMLRDGWEATAEGANLEIVQAKGDTWRVQRQERNGMECVSAWRAWREIADSTGRTQELAEALLDKLKRECFS